MRRKFLCAVLSLLMLVTMLPVVTGADDSSGSPTITFEQQTTAAGASEVKVDVKITNNPGFVSATIPVKWDASVMTLKDITLSTDVVAIGWCGMSMTDYATSGTQGIYYLAWNNDTRTEADGGNFTSDGKLCTMEFTVKDTSKDTSCDITANLEAAIANMMNFAMNDLCDSGLTAVSTKVNLKAADAGEKPTITVGTKRTKANKDVEVQVVMANNPGIVSMTLYVTFDETYLTLKEVKDGDGTNALLPGQTFKPEKNSPYTLSWSNDSSTVDYTDNGVLATLVFTVAESAPVGEIPIKVTYTNDEKTLDIYNKEAEFVDFTITNGSINVIEYIAGDLNGDGYVNARDRIILVRHLANWDDYKEIDKDAADLNEDGYVNARDRIILVRHLANWDDYKTLPMPVQ